MVIIFFFLKRDLNHQTVICNGWGQSSKFLCFSMKHDACRNLLVYAEKKSFVYTCALLQSPLLNEHVTVTLEN